VYSNGCVVIVEGEKKSSVEKKKSADKELLYTADRRLLLACVYFDQSHAGYLLDRDVEDIIHITGLQLSRAQVSLYVYHTTSLLIVFVLLALSFRSRLNLVSSRQTSGICRANFYKPTALRVQPTLSNKSRLDVFLLVVITRKPKQQHPVTAELAARAKCILLQAAR